ncbi:TIGR03564 family F420-dependent LLM class oxidoreductase [Kibdelosporangium phytohabitans]|uniref:FMN reductase n=1 Tax=Kibdelosporangium phytohabitans TaxID=860235 RepID=A0A0N9HZ83_9PSEU|nr:TIGR03564 family F420-dependent LLM class oxidoreductase [Kibdelosporangium phytohabitans]ALG09069.1 FMN reductase [Kibdelosporangium phytohabitans]MBE1469739.1 F420-dependent oxidoreductase-like protein [Kibdelosporangium phytohabitans]
MRIGIFVEEMGKTVDDYFQQVTAAHEAGIRTVWLGERLSWDPLTLLAMTSREFPDLTVGSAIVRTYARHPLALAAQALTAGPRLVLGIGPSHQPLVEGQYGYSYDKPVRHVREYLTALIPLLRGESVDYQGETLRAGGTIVAPGSQPPPVLLSALGPKMLQLAAELTDGTITVWAGPRTISDYFVPTLAKAGPGNKVVTSVTVSVTSDPESAREKLNQAYAPARDMPSYRKVLDREGVDGIGDTLVAGDETAVAAQLGRYRDAGATELIAIPVGTAEEQRRTVTLLGQGLL